MKIPIDCAHGVRFDLPCGACDPQPSIEATLQERGNRYGDFKEHARITQNLKLAMVDSPNWQALSADKKEALEMVAHKVGRILNGDPEYEDNVVDIIGYATLMLEVMRERKKKD